jgi:hypothetical protein
VNDVIEAINDCQAAFVIFDTLSRTMAGANENAPEDMTSMVGMFDMIRARTGAHVMLVHHSGKNELAGARGHSSLRAAVDVEMEVAANENGGRTMKITKGRDDADGKVVSFDLKSIKLGVDDDGDEIETCVVEMTSDAVKHSDKAPPKLSDFQRLVLQDVKNLLTARDCTAEHISPRPGMPKVHALARRAVVEELQKKGRLLSKAGESMTATDRSNLRNTFVALEVKGLLCATDDWVWIIR